ncbi:MAG: gliding motility-associated protein GldE [Bacteroidales bacterium]
MLPDFIPADLAPAFQDASQAGFALEQVIELLIILILLAASALMSGAEVAFFSLSPQDKQQLGQQKGKASKRVLLMLGKPEDLLATILVMNNLFNIGVVILAAWFSEAVMFMPDRPVLKFLSQIVLITFVIILVAEVLPKIYATRFPVRLARLMSLPLRILEQIARPVNRILVNSTSIVSRKLQESRKSSTIDQLSEALDLTGNDLKEEEKILKGIVRFASIEVREVMVPRVDIVALDITSPFSHVLSRMIEHAFSRFPVYQGDLDNLKGVLYLKDLLPHTHKTNPFRWQTLVRPPFFIPENKKISDLLEEFRANRMHLAIVVDEYGGTSGLISLEDILEEIVGEIRDESDEEEEVTYRTIGNNTYLFDGKTLLNDLVKILDLAADFFEEVRGGSDTVAGLILELLGEIPETGAEVSVGHLTFIVKGKDDRRIREVQIDCNNRENEEKD